MLDIMILDSNGNSIDHLTQWDYNQTLVISGDEIDTSNVTQVHFCNKNSDTAYCVAASIDSGGNICATIPNALLIEPFPIFAYVWHQVMVSGKPSGKTQYMLTIPIRKRTKPDDFEYEDNTSIIDLVQLQQDVIELQNSFGELENALGDLEDTIDSISETYASTSQYGLVKISSTGAISVSNGVIGVNTSTSYGTQKVNNYVAVAPATASEIAAKSNSYKPIVPATLKTAVETIGGALTSLNTTEKGSYVGAINEILGRTKYSNSNGTTVEVGGISIGTTFNNKSITEIIEDIFYPYVEFWIGGGSTSYVEYGTSVTASSVSFNITKGSKDITSLSFSASSNASISVTPTNISDAISTINALLCDENTTITVPCTFTGSSTADSTISVSASDGENSNTLTAKTYKPVQPIYRGVLTDSTYITAANIATLTKVAASSSTKGTKTYSYTCNNQIPIVAYPKSYGLLSTITDPNNFNVTADFLHTEITMNINGNNIVYYVYYLSGKTTCTNFNYKFAF